MPYIHHLQPIAFHIGNWSVHWYGLAYMVGFLFCRYWIARCYNQTMPVKKPLGNFAPPLASKDWDDFLLYGILATLVGGRLGFILLYHAGYFLTLPPDQWWQWLAVWQGGMAFHGAALGLVFAVMIFCRRKKIDRWFFADNFVRAVPLALFFGRVANFINGELVGRPIASAFWQQKIGVVFPMVDDQIRHASQLYEALFEGLVLFFLLHVVAEYKKHAPNKRAQQCLPNGVVFCCFLFFYGLFRFGVEFFRTPQDGFIGFLTAGQFWCGAMMLIGVGIYFARVGKRL